MEACQEPLPQGARAERQRVLLPQAPAPPPNIWLWFHPFGWKLTRGMRKGGTPTLEPPSRPSAPQSQGLKLRAAKRLTTEQT